MSNTKPCEIPEPYCHNSQDREAYATGWHARDAELAALEAENDRLLAQLPGNDMDRQLAELEAELATHRVGCPMVESQLSLANDRIAELERDVTVTWPTRVAKCGARIAELEAGRDRVLTEADDFQCSVASALGWDSKGKSMNECVRELVAIVEKLPRMEDGALWCTTDEFWFLDNDGKIICDRVCDFTLKELANFIDGEYGPCCSTRSAAEKAAKEGAGT